MLKIVLFPPFNETVGRRELGMPYTSGMTIAGLLEKLVRDYPALKAHLNKEHWDYQVMPMSAGKLVGVEHVLQDGEEVMLMQPAAGG